MAELTLTDQQQICMACRECCEYMEVPTSMIGSLQILEYWIVRGNKFYISAKDGLMHLRVHDPCKHLTQEGCDIYNDRPFVCRSYMCGPNNDTIIKMREEACKFSMDRIWELVQQHNKKLEGDKT